MITIFTPAYNRAHTLPKLYESLQKQTSMDFEWLVVDDGSNDETECLIENYKLQITNNIPSFEIRYIKQENGGKHTAINRGLEEAKGELFFIVDSDDRLTPDAVETISKDWVTVKDKNLCGISYLRGYSDGKVIGNGYPEADHTIANFIDMRYNRGIAGDKAEVWVTEIMKQFPYPKYEGERFFGESWNFIQQSEEHDMLWCNKIIYLCEYLVGGLTQSGRALRIHCPRGGRDMSLIAMGPRFNTKVRLKNAMLYVAYCFFAKMPMKEILDIRQWKLALLMLPAGWALYRYWRYRFS